jgi:pilus assembly protein Flp/PilA
MQEKVILFLPILNVLPLSIASSLNNREAPMFLTLRNLLHDESGVTAIEYGLIAALVSVAAIAALAAMGDSLVQIFGIVDTELGTAATTADGGG